MRLHERASRRLRWVASLLKISLPIPRKETKFEFSVITGLFTMFVDPKCIRKNTCF